MFDGSHEAGIEMGAPNSRGKNLQILTTFHPGRKSQQGTDGTRRVTESSDQHTEGQKMGK